MKQEKGKFAFSKDLFGCSVNSVLQESKNRDRKQLEAISKTRWVITDNGLNWDNEWQWVWGKRTEFFWSERTSQ